MVKMVAYGLVKKLRLCLQSFLKKKQYKLIAYCFRNQPTSSNTTVERHNSKGTTKRQTEEKKGMSQHTRKATKVKQVFITNSF